VAISEKMCASTSACAGTTIFFNCRRLAFITP
jgi:hypothetical protein